MKEVSAIVRDASAAKERAPPFPPLRQWVKAEEEMDMEAKEEREETEMHPPLAVSEIATQ